MTPKTKAELGMAHTCNSSTQEILKLKANLSYREGVSWVAWSTEKYCFKTLWAEDGAQGQSSGGLVCTRAWIQFSVPQ